jgi:hypothetical protein
MNPIWYIIIPAIMIGLAIYFVHQTDRDQGNYATRSTEKVLNGFYLDIYNHCAKHIDEYERERSACGLSSYLPKIQDFLARYNNRPDYGNPDQVALTILWNFTSDDLKRGHYHFHIGSLTPEGLAVQSFAEHCVSLSLKNGYISKQDADEALTSLYESIKTAG